MGYLNENHTFMIMIQFASLNLCLWNTVHITQQFDTPLQRAT